jgi:hypothetical protein
LEIARVVIYAICEFSTPTLPSPLNDQLLAIDANKKIDPCSKNQDFLLGISNQKALGMG